MANEITSLDAMLAEGDQETTAPAPVEQKEAPADVTHETKDETPQPAKEQGSGGSRRKAAQERERLAQEEGKAQMERARAPDGTFKKEESAVAPPAEPEKPKEAPPPPKQEMTDKERAFLRAAEEERHKRQELQRRLEALEAQAKQTEPKKEFWDDPEGKMREFQEQVQRTATETRLNTAEMIARSRHEDFDEKVQLFSQLVQENPNLRVQWLNSRDPAEFAYQIGANHKKLQEAGNMDNLLAKERADAEARGYARAQAELKEKMEKEAKEREALPKSLSDVRGTSQARVAFSGPTSLDAILSNK